MNSSISYLVPLLTAILLFQIAWLFAWKNKRNDYADVLWGPGFAITSLSALLVAPAIDGKSLFTVGLVCLWGLRLGWHIGKRNLSHAKEDERYAKWRKEWGRTAVWRSYLQVFVLQALILFVIDFPVLWIAAHPSAWAPLAYLGVGIWAIGFFFEAMGDYQLKKFTAEKGNKGKFIETGLWKYSRHPNYFGEITQWWGIYLIACSAPGGWLTFIGPAAITFLILKVSGVPMLEDHMKHRPGFAEYAKRVPKFVPFLR